MRNAGLVEAQAGIKIAGRNINNLRYADNTICRAENEEESDESEKLLESCLTVRPYGQQPTRLLCPQDSLGKNAGVGWYVLLQNRAAIHIQMQAFV